MKQYHFYFKDKHSFKKDLTIFKEKTGNKQVIFQVFSEVLYTDEVDAARSVIDKVFPDAPYIGASTGGTLINCECAKPISVVALVFESQTTRAEVREYDISVDSLENIAEKIVKFTNENLWIKSIELYYPVPKQSTTNFCALMSKIRPEVQITGAVTCSMDITSDACALFTSESKNKSSSTLMAVAYYGGDDLNVSSYCVQGWQPLGRVFKVTKAEKSVIYELDGTPACDIYKKYLNVEGDENFFFNTLEFPLYVMCNNVPVLRTPLSANPDGSITTSSDFEIGDEVRISYGDPVTIVNSITRDSKRLEEFGPEVMHIFSCIGRKKYWSTKEATYEIAPIAPISNSSGFFSLGEFLRSNGSLVQHNVTIVISAMREGDKNTTKKKTNVDKIYSNTKRSLASRLATFIGVTSAELQETNRKLAQAAITDGLTGLYNRKEIQKLIENEIENHNGNFTLIMLDIDNFKSVNDTYGHKSGDDVIIALSEILKDTAKNCGFNAAVGRWGGEEFMMLVCNSDTTSSKVIAEKIRDQFGKTKFDSIPSQTVSVGVAKFTENEGIDSVCSRVDNALYKAKAEGKNKVITA